MKNVFWFYRLNHCGGVESFFYYIAKKYGADHDITVYFGQADVAQALRLSEYVDVRQWHGEPIKCDRFFCNYENGILEYVEADEYYQIIHADYKAQNMKPHMHEKITKYIGVSKKVCETFKEVSGMETELSYNPLAIDKPRKVLNLISATRLTKEKGKARMERLAQMFDEHGIPYIWTVYTTDINAIPNPNIIYRRPRLDIIDFIANADYLVQLSDTEAYCYSVAEALTVHTPVIVTDCPVYHELGIEDGKHGFILDFDMENVPIEKIYKGITPKAITFPEDRWGEILEEGERETERLKEHKRLRCIKKFYDPKRKRTRERDERFSEEEWRANLLIDLKLVVEEQ